MAEPFDAPSIDFLADSSICRIEKKIELITASSKIEKRKMPINLGTAFFLQVILKNSLTESLQ